jgi:hypothetical protein
MDGLGYWHWLGLGVVLLIAEILLPGTFLIWFGAAAIVVGGVLFLAPALAWQWQMVLFVGLAVASIIGWRRYRDRNPATTSHPTLNLRGAQYIGRQLTLTEPFQNGQGRVRVDDTVWLARCSASSLPVGAVVQVVAVEGTVLVIEPRAGA